MEWNEKHRVNVVQPLVEPLTGPTRRAHAELSLLSERISELWLTLYNWSQPTHAVVRVERPRR